MALWLSVGWKSLWGVIAVQS